MIRPGQVYETCQPDHGHANSTHDGHIRIKVMGAPVGHKVTVATLTEEGRLTRHAAFHSHINESLGRLGGDR